MNHKRDYILIIILITIIICFFLACNKKPTEPEYDNPFDIIENTDTDPLQLTAQIANGGVTLSWVIPSYEGLQSFKIYRSEQETTGYSVLETIQSSQVQYVDETIENGHSYWYMVTAINNNDKESSRTNIASVNIKTEPVLVINGNDEYTPSRNVNLTILSNTATQMILSNNYDFSGATWENYITSKTWTLTTGEGLKMVYMKVKFDSTESPIVSVSILPQPINPTMVIFSGTMQYTTTNTVPITLSAQGDSLKMKISEDSTFIGLDWQTFSSSVNFNLSTNDGQKTVYMKIKNDFEIESEYIFADIILDTTPPSIILTVSPDSGITNETSFQFDPTASSDNTVPIQDMQVRFDYENDGTYDTDWQQASIINYQYTVGGGDKIVHMQLKDGAGWQVDTTITVFVNTRPTASFTVSENKANIHKLHFNASASSDYEDGENVEYRWDFDGDGNWESGWLMKDTISYIYTSSGYYAPKLIVRDQNNLTSVSEQNIYVYYSTITDIDSNVYKTAKIGNQVWMAENLKVTRYRNGIVIPHITDKTEWQDLSSSAYCTYENSNDNVGTYGLLYNWYAVDDINNIAPEGWHIPTDEEWKELEMYLGMSQSEADYTDWRGMDEGTKLKATSDWENIGNGTNERGFKALPGGYRISNEGRFHGIGYFGSWWSTSEFSSDYVWYRDLSYDKSGIFRYYTDKRNGFSVRCVRD